MSILSLAAKLVLDGRNFKAGIREAQHEAQHFANHQMKEVKGAITEAFGVFAVYEFAKGITEAATRIKHLSEQTGITTDEIQKIDFAANEVGKSFEDWEVALTRINKSRKEAGSNKDIRDFFLNFGISFERVNDATVKSNDILIEMLKNSKGMSANAKERAEFDTIAGKKAESLLSIHEKLEHVHISLIKESDINDIEKLEIAMKRLYKQAQALGSVEIASFSRLVRGEASWKDYLKGFISPIGGKAILEQFEKTLNMGKESKHKGSGESGIQEGPREATVGENIKQIQDLMDQPFSKERDDAVDALRKKLPWAANTNERISDDAIGKKKEKEMMEAQEKLSESVYQLELKRIYGTSKRLHLQREILDLERKAKIEGVGSIENIKTREEINKKKLELDNLKPETHLSADELQKKGVLTGGSFGRAAFYDSVGAGVSNSDISGKQLTVAQHQLAVLKDIARRRASEVVVAGH